MQRRRIVTAAAMTAAVGVAVAVTLPSMAGTTPSGETRKAPSAATTGDNPSEVLKAMQRDLGITADEARARLKRQQWAGKVSSQVRTAAADTYAGAWLGKDGTTLNIAVTDAEVAAAVQRTGAEAKVVARSEQQLAGIKRKLDTSATRADRELPGWYVDVAANKVVVLAAPGDADEAREFAEDAGIDRDAVTVKTTRAQPRTLADVRGGDAYFINVNGQQGRCSIGFAVQGGFVTAGHCGAEGTTTSSEDGTIDGVVRQSTFPGSGDLGFVEVNADAVLRPVVNDFAGNELPVAGNLEAPVGAAICRSGSTTGTRCGVVEAKNQTVNYPEGTVTGLTRTNVCAEGGDSGGSWLSGDQAQGVTSGGSGNCTIGGETFFQPLNEILEVNDLTLLTVDNAGEQPPADGAEQPPADGDEQPPADGGEQGGDEQGGGQQGGGGPGAEDGGLDIIEIIAGIIAGRNANR